MGRMKSGVTRRSFVLGTAAAAVMAGLAGCDTGGGQGTATSEESVAPAAVTDNLYYASDYDYTLEGEQKLVDDQMALGKQIVNEGVVLLRNEGTALPISSADGVVTAFGNAGPTYHAGFDEAMKEAGFSFNDAAWDFYTNGSQNVLGWQVNENPWSDVEAAGFIQDDGGVALVFLGRRGHEGSDTQWYADHDYLALSQEEKDMLSGVAALRRAGSFSKMVVCVSTANTISWEDGDWSDAIDALVWYGNVSTSGYGAALPYGIPALVEVLDGTVNPSGRLADTIYKDNQANPVMPNFGRVDANLSELSDGKLDEVSRANDEWRPSNTKGNHWRHDYVYAEGIYLGYRYPETRYEDKVLGQGNAGDFDYNSYVAYPFGAGISYSSFSYSDFAVEEGDDAFTVTVTVTNDGPMAGKHAALVYVQTPYTDYDRESHIEKASIELKGYEKTQELEPGASETLAIGISKHELAAYDAEGAKTYVLDEGDYYFTVAGSSHEAMNNVLTAKGMTVADGMTEDGDDSVVWVWNNPALDTETYAVSTVTGNAITNLFDDVDPNKNSLMSEKNAIVWLSRSDWEGTFPTGPANLVYTDEVADKAKPISYQAGSGDASSVPTHSFGQSSDLVLVDMRGKDYDDGDWETLVSKLTYEEMVDFINDPESPIAKIGKPETVAGNGSQGWTPLYTVSGLSGMTWPSKETTAATFNTQVHEGIGGLTGENLLHSATMESKNVSLYGWSCNAHRSPYSGRNFEYFSEDPYLGGRACAEETRSIIEKGALVYTKHCAGNDQEEYRHGVPSWANEQTLREIYLRQFEKTVVEGHANGIMSGFHRLGMDWSGENRALLVDWLEGELGYKGTTITDQFEAPQMDAPDGLLGGTHVWLGTTSDNDGRKVCRAVLLQDDYKSDPVIQDALFGAVHRALYNYANSLAMNGLTHEYAFSGNEPLVTAVASSEAEDAVAAPCAFYGDKTWIAEQSGFFGSTRASGTWDYAEDGGLTMADSDGGSIEVSSDGGLLSFAIPITGGAAYNTVSAYELVTACNDYFGASFDAGEQPSFQLTFAAGNDAATGSAPSTMEIRRGEAITLPDCPYAVEHMTFDGWSVGGTTYPAGSEYVPDVYADVEAQAAWSTTVLAMATTYDDYIYSYVQDDGIPMVLLADGTVEVDHYKGYACMGTWSVEGSGSGAATLTILNEAGAPVAVESDGNTLTYAQEGLVYDWNQPDQGYGSGMFMAMLTHSVDLTSFIEAYNAEFGTSYDSVEVEAGSAEFALEETGEPKSVF